MNEAKWINVPSTLHPSNLAYILPCEKGVAIYYGDEMCVIMCVIEGLDVQECLDKLKAFDDEITFKERINMINKGE